MSPFHRFPSTPHLAWLASTPPRSDKVLSLAEANAVLEGEVVVEEKVDGANVGISFRGSEIVVQNRGTIVAAGGHAQFGPLWPWLAERRDGLHDALGNTLTLFGEWCFAVHSITYTRLPDWFVGFDVYDRDADVFYSCQRRDALFARLGVTGAPRIGSGRYTLAALVDLTRTNASAFGNERAEGVVVRRDAGGLLKSRAKIVRAEFMQAIEVHWKSKPLQRNALAAHGVSC